MEIKNRQVLHEYTILEKLEAGIQLAGHEIKSIRDGHVNLKGGFCKFVKEELFLFDVNIAKYEHIDAFTNIEAKRPRKLLLHRKELNKWLKEVKLSGLAIVPLRMYFTKNNLCKIEIGLAQGKKNYDKRAALKEKDIKRQTEIENKDY